MLFCYITNKILVFDTFSEENGPPCFGWPVSVFHLLPYYSKAFWGQKSQKLLSLSLVAKEGGIETATLPEQRISLSAPITRAYDDDDFAVAGDFFAIKVHFRPL